MGGRFPVPRLGVITRDFCATGGQKSSGDEAQDCHRGHSTKTPISWQLQRTYLPGKDLREGEFGTPGGVVPPGAVIPPGTAEEMAPGPLQSEQYPERQEKVPVLPASRAVITAVLASSSPPHTVDPEGF